MRKLIILAMLFLGWTTRTAAQETVVAAADSTAVPAADSLAVAAEPEEEISVTKFSCLTNDLTARVIAPKRDQNNEVCAVIKIVTKDKSLFFEPDALGITAREDQPGEIWLYVPHGAKRITIKHERFGIIRNYFYPEPINEAMVYEMMLYVPEEKGGTRIVEKVVEKAATAQALMMNYSPATAQIYIDDTLRTARNGAYSEIFLVGEHKYRVCREHYTEETGTFEIVPEHPTVLNVQLPAAYGLIRVNADQPASEVSINGEYKGYAPYQTDTIPTGRYTIHVEKKHFYPIDDTIQLKPARLEELDYKLKRIRVNTFLMAQLAGAMDADQMSYGLFLGFCRNFGAYFNFHSNGNTDDDFMQDVNPANYVYDGQTKKVRYAASMGVMARLWKKYLYLYAGAGYGVRRYGWHEVQNGYDIAIDDHEGGLGEVGLIGRYKWLALSAGFRSNFNFNYKEFAVGIGVVFGK